MRYGTIYYWRVCSINAVDTSGWSDTWQFHTTDCVVLDSPSNDTSSTSGRYTRQEFSWRNSKGSSSYILQLDTTPDFNSSILRSFTKTNSQSNTDTYVSYVVNDMRYGTTYYWRVCSINAVDTSGRSDTWHFTTSYQLTTAPVLTAPANDTIGIPYNSSVAFSWQPIENVQGYYYQISTNNDFSTIVAQGNTSLTFTSVSNFSPTTTYYWRVRGYNNSGNSVWSQVWHFTTNDVVLTPPVLVSPANDATVQTSNITLTWQSVFGANNYELQFSMDANFATAVTNFTTTGTQYSLTGIPDNTTLYWRVRATNGNTYSDWSAPWHFTTNGCQTSSYSFSHLMCDGETYNFFGQTLTTSGDYSQVLTNATGCDSTVTLHLTLTVGIDNWTENGVIIYPNPTQGKLRIENGEFGAWELLMSMENYCR